MIVFNKLPNEYQEVEYIESSGTQYINTGVLGKASIGYDMEVKIKAYGIEYGVLATSTNINRPHYVLQAHSGALRLYLTKPGSTGATTNVVTYQSDTTDFHVVTYNVENDFKAYYDGAYKATSSVQDTPDIPYPFTIFARNIGGVVQKYSYSIIKYLKMYDAGVLIRNFIPCYRKSDNEIGMYDTVEKNFYTNKGTGVFLKGQDIIALDISSIVLGIKEVKKIEDTNGNIWWQKPSSNIFDPTTATVIQAYFENGTPNITSNAGNRVTYVACQPNTTYEIKKLLGKIFWVGCTVNEPAIGVATTSRQVGTTGTYDGTTTTSTTFTTDSTANYLVVRYTSIWTDGSANENSIFNSIEIYEQ